MCEIHICYSGFNQGFVRFYPSRVLGGLTLASPWMSNWEKGLPFFCPRGLLDEWQAESVRARRSLRAVVRLMTNKLTHTYGYIGRRWKHREMLIAASVAMFSPGPGANNKWLHDITPPRTACPSLHFAQATALNPSPLSLRIVIPGQGFNRLRILEQSHYRLTKTFEMLFGLFERRFSPPCALRLRCDIVGPCSSYYLNLRTFFTLIYDLSYCHCVHRIVKCDIVKQKKLI